ncbi:U6 snRNA-associated Sm-like protein LSm6 [Violaceomyces palustris]|uniref:U6 snRNA-associated Sm-like protein LSm6 n=1 Tax=Violaceomyces palustris TaxID=1673888 RepID=A0ACD0P6B3_9BASI|nr:U6 snRNA-associated Sm-like protein LSm6 [Violaceomyces palustris]
MTDSDQVSPAAGQEARPSSSPEAQAPQTKTGSPNDFLKGVIGKQVVVRLNSGVDYRGILSCLDGYMNIALEQTIEYVDGVAKSSYGDAFIRGNNVLYISAVKN